MLHWRPLAWLLLSGLWLTSTGAAFGQVGGPWTPPGGLGVVFVANGSGDSFAVTANLQRALAISGIPLSVETIRWSRYGDTLRDHLDVEGHVLAGVLLAERVAAYRAACPNGKIYLMSHSAGSHVLLTSAALLPPGTVERMVLLAPSVSWCADLRPALRCARQGIDCYFSPRDYAVRLATDTVGTADGQLTRTAGERGFACPSPWHPDAPLYWKLRQLGWDRSLTWTGHNGSHEGVTTSGFLSAYVLPAMLMPAGIE